jgi:putative sigma-54 modulation protein
MQVTVSGRHTTVSDALREQAIEKIGRLERYLDGMERAEVHFWEEHNARVADREICEVTMEGHGHHVRTKVSAPDGFTAIDLAVEKLEGQLRKLKSRLVARKHARQRPELPTDLVPETLLPADEVGPEPIYRIVKAKRFEVRAMDPQEAALQMDLLNHDFYVFTNSETDGAAVVYRRTDGDVGLIDVT